MPLLPINFSSLLWKVALTPCFNSFVVCIHIQDRKRLSRGHNKWRGSGSLLGGAITENAVMIVFVPGFGIFHLTYLYAQGGWEDSILYLQWHACFNQTGQTQINIIILKSKYFSSKNHGIPPKKFAVADTWRGMQGITANHVAQRFFRLLGTTLMWQLLSDSVCKSSYWGFHMEASSCCAKYTMWEK